MNKNYELEVQAKLIKNWEKSRLMWGKTDDYIFFTENGFVGYYIPKEHFLIDEKFLHIKSTKNTNVECLSNPNGNYVSATYIGTIIHGNKNLAVLLGNDGRKVYFDLKLFKEFNNPDFTYQIGSETQVARVYLLGELFAIICPIKYNKETK